VVGMVWFIRLRGTEPQRPFLFNPGGMVSVDLFQAMEVALMNQRQESEGQESDQADERAQANSPRSGWHPTFAFSAAVVPVLAHKELLVG
jgi:hypothetical protein